MIPAAERLLAEHAARTARPLFQLYGWTWRDEGVPDEARIVTTILRLMEAAKVHSGTAASGRFVVECDEDGTSVSLVLGKYSTEDE